MLKDYYQKLRNSFAVHVQHSRGLGIGIDMYRDWKILATFFLSFCFLLLVLDVYFFYAGHIQINDGLKIKVEDSVILDKSKLEKVIIDWHGRELEFNKVLGSKSRLVDPAL